MSAIDISKSSILSSSNSNSTFSSPSSTPLSTPASSFRTSVDAMETGSPAKATSGTSQVSETTKKYSLPNTSSTQTVVNGVMAMSSVLAKAGLPQILLSLAQSQLAQQKSSVQVVSAAITGAAVGLKNVLVKGIKSAVAAIVGAAIGLKNSVANLLSPKAKPVVSQAQIRADNQVKLLSAEAETLNQELSNLEGEIAAKGCKTESDIALKAFIKDRQSKVASQIDLQEGFINSKFDGQSILDEVSDKLFQLGLWDAPLSK